MPPAKKTSRRASGPDFDWFVHDRFGMFIHWGLYALPARHEWVKNREKIADADHQAEIRRAVLHGLK